MSNLAGILILGVLGAAAGFIFEGVVWLSREAQPWSWFTTKSFGLLGILAGIYFALTEKPKASVSDDTPESNS